MNISNECFNGAKLYIFSQTSRLFTYFYIRRQNSWISVKPFSSNHPYPSFGKRGDAEDSFP